MHTVHTRLAVLVNFIPPYRVPFFKALSRHVAELKVFVSTPMEPGRNWPADWQGLNVQPQKNWMIRWRWRHPQGFEEPMVSHIPYDTLWRLWQWRPDTVISAEFGARTAQAALYCLLARKKLVIWATLSEQSERGRGKARRLLRHLLIALADRILVNGESGARYLRSFGIKDERIQRVPQSTEMSALLALPLGRAPTEIKRLVYLGRLIELKGLEGFITQLSAWCARHTDQQVELQLVGDGPLRRPLESLTRAPNLKLVFRGEVPYEQLPGVLREAGILVFPTLSDEWGLVVVEAMAAGLPVLGSLYGQAVEELVRNGENGWVFRPDHAAELDQALDAALLCPDSDLMRMRARARETVRTLTPESMVERVLKALADKSESNSRD